MTDLMVRAPYPAQARLLTAYFPVRDPHVPDMRTQDGVLDILAVGCILEFTTALNRGRYNKAYDPNSPEACAARTRENQARTWFRVLMKTFGEKYTITMQWKAVHPTYLWHSVMVGFAAALVNYVAAQAQEIEFHPGVSPKAIAKAVRDHFKTDHPHLLAPYDAALRATPLVTNLTWIGPDFQVVRKPKTFGPLMEALGISEHGQLAEIPLYPLRGSTARRASEELNRYYDGIWPGEETLDVGGEAQ